MPRFAQGRLADPPEPPPIRACPARWPLTAPAPIPVPRPQGPIDHCCVIRVFDRQYNRPGPVEGAAAISAHPLAVLELLACVPPSGMVPAVIPGVNCGSPVGNGWRGSGRAAGGSVGRIKRGPMCFHGSASISRSRTSWQVTRACQARKTRTSRMTLSNRRPCQGAERVRSRRCRRQQAEGPDRRARRLPRRAERSHTPRRLHLQVFRRSRGRSRRRRAPGRRCQTLRAASPSPMRPGNSVDRTGGRGGSGCFKRCQGGRSAWCSMPCF